VVLQKLITDIVAVQQAEAESHSIALVCKLPDTPLQVSADMQRMTQVITNLVANAINYTPDGGQVTVELDQEPETPGHPTGQAIVRVHDTGVGIAPDLLPQIFEPFFRANEGSGSGVGLGLTITREIVHLHGGEITAESEIGQGSVFTIEMDLLAAPEIES
jgi:signal transduction histidine kinase